MKNYPLYEAPSYETVRELVEFIGETYSEDTAYSYILHYTEQFLSGLHTCSLAH